VRVIYYEQASTIIENGQAIRQFLFTPSLERVEDYLNYNLTDLYHQTIVYEG
jgi:hypothetical protein